jgi:hypothetical protein
MNIDEIFNRYENNIDQDLADLLEKPEELMKVIQDPHAFKKKKSIQQKPMKKVRTKRNRRK